MFLSFKTHTANHTGRDSRCAPVLPSLPSNPWGFYVSREGQHIADLIHPTNFRKKTKVGFLIAIKWLIHFAVFSCFMALRWLSSPSRSQKQACGFRGMPAAAEGVLNEGTPRLSCCCCSVAQLCPALCDPMDCSTPGFPVLHHLLEFAQTHVRWVGDAIQPSHLLSPPSLPAFSFSQHQSLFQWVNPLHQVAKELELQL